MSRGASAKADQADRALLSTPPVSPQEQGVAELARKMAERDGHKWESLPAVAQWNNDLGRDQHTLSQFRYTELAHNALAELEPRLERYHAALERAGHYIDRLEAVQAGRCVRDLNEAQVGYRTALGQTGEATESSLQTTP